MSIQMGYWWGHRAAIREGTVRFEREVLAGISAGTELAVTIRTAGIKAEYQLVVERAHAQQVEIIKGSVIAGVVATQEAGKLTLKQAATLIGFTLPNYHKHRNTVLEAAMQLHRSKQ